MELEGIKQLKNLIEFAQLEKRYKQVLEISDRYLRQVGSDSYIHMTRIQAYLQISEPSSALTECQQAEKCGANESQVGLYRIRCHIQLQNMHDAQNTFNRLLEIRPDFRKIINYQKALQILRDKDNKYRLSLEQEQILIKMKEWLIGGGARFDKMRIVNFSQTYRGVITTKPIKKGEQIVYVPKSQIMTLQMAKKNKYSSEILRNRVKLLSPKHTFISILLLQERANPKSKWKPYIDLLPTDHSNFPINYRTEELQMLIGSPFLFMINEKVKDLRRDYDSVVKCCRDFQKYSFKDFCWARMMVGSRIFGLMISGIKTQVLVPFADMLNHKMPKQTVWNYIEHLNGFTIDSLENIDAGEEVFDSYGRKCNTRFLLNYGFILQDNADNEIALKLSISESDPLAKLKLKMMKEEEREMFSAVMKVGLNLNSNKFYSFMGCLRFSVITEIECLKILYKISNIEVTKQAYKWSRTPPLSLKNQVEGWFKFVEICKQALGNYPNSIDEDRKLLKQPKLTQNMKNIINLRMGEKYILTEFIQLGTQIMAILESEMMLDILEKQKDKIYFKYLCKMLSVMPGINKAELGKRIGQNGSNNEVEEQDFQEEEIEQIN